MAGYPPSDPGGLQALTSALLERQEPNLGERLYAESEGLPLFAVELLRFWQEQSEGQDPGRDPLRGGDVPAALRAVVNDRFNNLPEVQRILLNVASIFPNGTSLRLLAAVAELDEAETIGALEGLLKVGFLREVGKRISPTGGAWPGQIWGEMEPELVFDHNLVRRIIGDRLSLARLQVLHRRVYRRLEVIWERRAQGDQPSPGAMLSLTEEMIFHATAGGLWEEALAWSGQAAAAARTASAFPAEIRFMEQMILCLKRLPLTPQRCRQLVTTCLELVNKSIYYHRAERLEEWVAQAAEAAATLADPVLQATVQVAKARILGSQGHYHPSLAALEEALAVARTANDQALLGASLQILGRLKAVFHDPVQVIRVLEEVIPIQEGLGNAREVMLDRAYLATAYRNQGEFAKAEAMLQALLRGSREAGDPVALAHVLRSLAALKHLQGKWAEAIAAAREAVAIAREAKDRQEEYLASIFLGLPLVRLGDGRGGRAIQERAIALGRQAGTKMYLGRAQAWLGEIHLLSGQLVAARAAAAAGRKIAMTSGALFDAALCTRILGEVAMVQGRTNRARNLVAQALERFVAIGRKPEEARCRALLAEVAVTEEERTEYRRQAEEMFAVMEMQWDLECLLSLSNSGNDG